jgi:hypothetical protein
MELEKIQANSMKPLGWDKTSVVRRVPSNNQAVVQKLFVRKIGIL